MLKFEFCSDVIFASSIEFKHRTQQFANRILSDMSICKRNKIL